MSAYKRTALSNADYVRSRPNADVRSFRPVLCHSNVSFWHLADIAPGAQNVAFGGKADIDVKDFYFRF
jgi:hypothetical protein